MRCLARRSRSKPAAAHYHLAHRSPRRSAGGFSFPNAVRQPRRRTPIAPNVNPDATPQRRPCGLKSAPVVFSPIYRACQPRLQSLQIRPKCHQIATDSGRVFPNSLPYNDLQQFVIYKQNPYILLARPRTVRYTSSSTLLPVGWLSTGNHAAASRGGKTGGDACF